MDASIDFAAMKVADLRRELKTRGLTSTGNKTELLERLQLSVTTKSGSGSDGEDELLAEDVLLAGDDEVAATKAPPKKVAIKRDSLPAAAPANGKENIDTEAPPPAKKAALIEGAEKKNEITAPDAEAAAGDAAEKKTGGKTDTEKAAARAARFGLPVKEVVEEKKAARADRFGIKVSPDGKASPASKIGGAPAVDVETLKKRAERFGQTSSKTLQKLEVDEKIKKRQERFGKEEATVVVAVTEVPAVDTETTPVVKDEKMKKRAERFAAAAAAVV